MINSPSSGIPRPVSGSDRDLNKLGGTTSGYQAREMKAKEEKEKKESQRKIELLKLEISKEKTALAAENIALVRFRQEIDELERRARNSTAPKLKPISSVQNAERQDAARIAEDERKVKDLEEEMSKLGDGVKTNERLLAEKVQEEKNETRKIAEIEEEIRLKNIELGTIEREHEGIQREISQLSTSQKNITVSNASNKKREIERLKGEISRLGQSLETKRQVIEKTNKENFDATKQTEAQKQVLDELSKKERIAINRVKDFEQNIKRLEQQMSIIQ